MVRPVLGIVHQHAQFDPDMDRVDADILAGTPERPRPIPHITEHSFVQSDREVIREHFSPMSREPAQARLDIGLLELIQFLARCDVFKFQTAELIGIKRRRPIRVIHHYGHLSLRNPNASPVQFRA